MTAEEKLIANFYNGSFIEIHSGDKEHIREIMIEFAKYHVEQALNDIYEKAKHGDEEHQLWLKEFFDNYPLDNIK